MHSHYPERISKPDINQDNAHQWLKNSGLKVETEGFIIAAEDQSLPTKLYRHSNIKNGSDPKYRMCHNCGESIDHIVSGCPVLDKDEYLHRHEQAAAYIHWNICKHYNVPAAEKWYEPNTVTENDECTILWDMPIHTDCEIKANRPDIIVKDKEQKQSYLINITVSLERNVLAKEADKLSKYKYLEIEIMRMWGMKTLAIPVVFGALGLIKNELGRYISKIPGKIDIGEMQNLCFLEQHTF